MIYMYILLQVCETWEVKLKTSLCLNVHHALETHASLIFSAQLR